MRFARKILLSICVLVVLASLAGWVLYQFRSDVWHRWGSRTIGIAIRDGQVDLNWERKVFRSVQPGSVEFRREGRIDYSPYFDERSDHLEMPAAWQHSGSWDRSGSGLPWLSAHIELRPGWNTVQMQGPDHPAILVFDQGMAWISLLLLALVASFPPLASVIRHAARRQVATGLCQSCGYDLRATQVRCPECGHAVSEPILLRVTRWRAGLVAFALLSAVAVTVLAIESLVGESPSRGMLFEAIYLPNPERPPGPDEPRAPRRVPEAAVWVQQGALRVAETHFRSSQVFLPHQTIAKSTVPTLTGMAWLEPAYHRVNDRGRPVHVVTLPLWLLFLTLIGGPVLWFRRIRRRGGFYLGRPTRDPPPGETELH